MPIAFSHRDQKPYRIGLNPDRSIVIKELSKDEAQREVDSLIFFEGLCDLQVNGYNGIDFSDHDLTVDQIEQLCQELARLGVTRFLPTLTTNSQDRLAAGMKTIARAVEVGNLAKQMIVGIHLEGPYISAQDGARGAHPLEHCRPPSASEFRKFQDAANGLIRILTLSPEYENAEEFIKQIATEVIVSIGHTAASVSQIRVAIQAGATMATHLGNGMPDQIKRHPNHLWELLAADDVHIGLIADGAHLPDATLKSFVRAKSPDRCFFVSDSTGLSGRSPGVYRGAGLGKVEVTSDKRLVIAGQDQYLAGAYKPLIESIPTAVAADAADFNTALAMASQNARRLIQPEVDIDSTFVIAKQGADQRLEILLVVISNQIVFQSPQFDLHG